MLTLLLQNKGEDYAGAAEPTFEALHTLTLSKDIRSLTLSTVHRSLSLTPVHRTATLEK